ncbi:PepSY domain-containing protein [Candidatus Xianfuyuplasma coldseepsis]|uniref:PepSY domain-containing protein n=1 Tax=Candidatus Xianfuyuplasma coldseepsis TaxID=2782163 RepID=A0A7L7KSP8_9MOLU|nr:PepSY domain-containing protein [Xianfuyuplasma coldseepsis]QMS85292.1 hypothetical protein G4Z02_05850 [Xianfuyuplasma coldseepsis]
MKKLSTLVLTALVLVTLAACSTGSASAASTIAIDVNPSIVLELDDNDNVINVILNNEDAATIIGDMDLVGVDYNVALNAIVGSMVANGFISELQNSVLLSVSSDDEQHEVNLLAELAQTINNYLSGSAIEGSIITQSLDFDDDAEALAELLDISEAKAELILEIVELDPRVVVEELALLSINDLNLLLEAKDYQLDGVDKVGTASELSLITAEEAYQAAVLHFELDEATIVEFEVELETEDGIIVYEVELETDNEEYEVYIHAEEGTVYVEMDDDDDDDDDVFPEDALSEEAMMQLVATELNVDLSMVTELEMEAEMDNGVAYYEIEFMYEGQEFELEVDAVNGTFYYQEIETDEDDDDEEEYDEYDDESDDVEDTEEDSLDDTEDETVEEETTETEDTTTES